MKSASNFWIFLILTSFFFNCTTQKTGSNVVPMQKAYVLLRTEGSEKEINELTNVLNSNFVNNKIASDINYYTTGQTWNINQIFTTTYNNNYDYIVLIDQVAKFTIDKKTHVGGKYQIRKYHIKSSSPDWVDLGQKTCNVSVRQSIDKFSEQIIREIAPNFVPATVPYKKENSNTKENQTGITAIDYNQLKSAEEMEIEISQLKKELEKEKERTKKAIAQKEQLEKDYENELNFQKKKNKNIIEGLKAQKRKKEIVEETGQEEVLLEAKKRKDNRVLKKALEQEQKQIEDKRFEEVKRKEEALSLKDLEKKNLKQEKDLARKTRKSSHNKNKPKDEGVPVNISNALLIIRGQDKDHQLFQDLQEYLEFELLFANIKASTQIINTEKTFDRANVLKWNKSKYQYLILINKIENNESEESVFKISVHSDKTTSDWTDLDEISFDLSDRKSLTKFSKTVLKSL